MAEAWHAGRYVGAMEEEDTGPGADDVARAYDVVARSYAELIPTTGSEGDPETDLELAMVREFAASLPSGAAILDAGCGPGRMITYLDTLAALAVDGCDISRCMVRLAREAHPQKRFTVAELSSLPYADESFHGVLAWYSIIHTPPAGLANVFAEFRRVLKPGGVVLLGFTAGNGARTITNAYGHDVELYGHDVELTAYPHDLAEVSTCLGHNGFRVGTTLSRAPAGRERQAQGFISVLKPS
ncbi:class I SAM-dependent methyltransferase [Arthrobacter zhaoxinii]|uniref:Class I SAM-dependent methyltransferase n=1 Tax=Arthrobacter zhaoxinii TaxID=2964616 RepID=A0ABY5YPY2_9MICC|nr:class I SAM-dependent methyltransferase [Arthrobacter zhaoxinii]UWX97135.1 class I SAM-dependent methyltransferase [Arthrobacter zhaoxinii]